jgi:hypothetical protein
MKRRLAFVFVVVSKRGWEYVCFWRTMKLIIHMLLYREVVFSNDVTSYHERVADQGLIKFSTIISTRKDVYQFQ